MTWLQETFGPQAPGPDWSSEDQEMLTVPPGAFGLTSQGREVRKMTVVEWRRPTTECSQPDTVSKQRPVENRWERREVPFNFNQFERSIARASIGREAAGISALG